MLFTFSWLCFEIFLDPDDGKRICRNVEIYCLKMTFLSLQFLVKLLAGSKIFRRLRGLMDEPTWQTIKEIEKINLKLARTTVSKEFVIDCASFGIV